MNEYKNIKDSKILTDNLEKSLNELINTTIQNDKEIKQAILSNPQMVKKLLQANIIDEVKADLQKEKLARQFNYDSERAIFLDQKKSKHTREGYARALKDFELFIYPDNERNQAETIDLENIELSRRIYNATPSQADKWIVSQYGIKSPATIRRNSGALSSFYSYLERITDFKIKNIFRGTKARPKKENAKPIEKEIPAHNLALFKKDIQTILDNEKNPEMKAIISILAFRGLRCGAIQNLTIHSSKFFTVSKGKEISGNLPPICLKLIDSAGLKHNAPFSTWSADHVKNNFKYRTTKLYQAGKIAHTYSAHDLRHYYALMEYSQNKDIYRLSKLLDHSSISVTELYLKGLKVLEVN